ncbi:MAG: hypothetical protein IJW46_05905 [Clostridia bacterium]|nr:hypothetical protein [Clostridia bacterium]
MPYTVLLQNIKVPLDKRERALCDRDALRQAEKKLLAQGITANRVTIAKRSVDARRRDSILYLYSVAAELEAPPSEEAIAKLSLVMLAKADYAPTVGTEELAARPVVVGFGPAGMFAALALAERGYRPLVLERGKDVDARSRDVSAFRERGILDTESNIQFGAGGAGTFSDGKLVTRKNDPLCAYVLSRLVEFGANSDILVNAKPHIGTDVLKTVVKQIEARILSLGGEIRYGARVKAIAPHTRGVCLSTEEDTVLAGAVVLAIGHSARDTYRHLYESGHRLQPKAFSVGVRIEHLCEDIDEALYGDARRYLPHAEYSLSYREGARGVYSFCMCPGGEVVAAASETESVVTNGMSNSRRDGKNDNAALCVSVLPEDYGNDPMGAIAYQRRLEKAAYRAAVARGGDLYAAPIMTVGDLLSGKYGTAPSRIQPSYRGGNTVPCDLTAILPSYVSELLKRGMVRFGKTIRGFDAPDAILTGVETRTSAPLRILRSEHGESLSVPYLYPCGEGAGYAGGITSAALDGLKIAASLMGRFKPLE